MSRWLAIAVAAIGVLAFGSLFLYAHHVNKRAELMVRTAYELSEQKQIPTIADIRERFGKQLKQLDGCTASECGYVVVLSNRALAALPTIPFTELKSYFWVRDGLVLEAMVDYTTTVNHRYSVVSHVQIDFCKGCQTFAIHPWNESSPLDTNGLVEIGREASAQNRRTVLSLNTRCLTKLGGCDSVADLLPTVWQQTADKRIACRIQNDKGFVENPANWP
ncbi:MAG TPA: hypothetical protein VNZ03_21455 [Terriglobales bacterium]|jgi:hypothetical protein|nr:hypothetical protein [Terriglobales bacterium]